MRRRVSLGKTSEMCQQIGRKQPGTVNVSCHNLCFPWKRTVMRGLTAPLIAAQIILIVMTSKSFFVA